MTQFEVLPNYPMSITKETNYRDVKNKGHFVFLHTKYENLNLVFGN